MRLQNKLWKCMHIFKRITTSFLIWRLVLFLAAFASIYFLPVFGARFPYADRVLEITHLPYWVWGWGNFDGVHYLRIAQDGYLAQYSQAFFPVFPMLIKLVSFIFPKNLSLNATLYTDPSFFYSGLILSNLFFLSSLYILYKLINLDFKKDVASLSIVLLLVFPTSFYFGAIYTESLFLFLSVLSVYLVRKNRFFLAAIIISISTATRITGILLILFYLIEAIGSKKKLNLVWLLITPLGLLAYMYYLKIVFNNPIYFLTSQPSFGAGRSDSLILLPQVIYRYIRIFLTTNILTLPFFNAFLEFVFTLFPLTALVIWFKKIRFSYWVFSLTTLLLGTFTGTFLSMPRFALISIAFILPQIVIATGRYIKPILFLLGLMASILIMLFIRGYWVA